MGEKVTENPLRPRQTAAIAALLNTGKVTDAAAAGGVTTKTVYAWLRQPDFSAALRAAEADALRSLSRRLAGLGEAAADALKDALDEDQPIGIRLRAADLVTARGPALAELTDLVARLEALEARL
jgi:hypothetical protein